MTHKYLLLVSIILTGVLYAIFYSGLLPQFLLGEITGSYVLSYNPECPTTANYCRSLGYPFLQNIFLFFQVNGHVFIFFQVLLFSFSCAFLASEFYKLTSQKILTYLLFFSIYLNPKVFKYALTITEEGVFPTLIAIVTALIIKFSRDKSINTLFILSFVIGVAIAVRPAAYAMLPLLPIILFIYWQQFKNTKVKVILFLFIPVFLLVTGESYLYHSNNPQDRETTQGVVLLGKVPLVGITKPLNSKYSELSNIAYERGKLVRSAIDSASNFSIQQYLRNVFNPMYNDLGGLYQPLSDKIDLYKQSVGSRDVVTTGLFKEYAKENPLTTIKIIALNFVGLWQLSEILTPEQRTEFSNWLQEGHIKDKYHKDRIDYYFSIVKNHASFAQIAKIVVLFLLLATIYLFIYGVFNLIKSFKAKKEISPAHFSAFIFPIMLNGYFLLIAIMINVQMRFILTYWSVLMVILFLALYLLINQLRKTNFKI